MANTDIISVEELAACSSRFHQIYALSQKLNDNFAEKIQKICEQNKTISAKNFSEKTGYPLKRFYRLIHEESFNIQTLVSFFIVFEIDLQTAFNLLKSLGITFSPTNKVHYAYCYLISEYSGETLYKCNEILKYLGFKNSEFLGSKDSWPI